MSRVIIHYEVQRPGWPGLSIEHFQELQPFLMAKPGLAGADQGPREDIEGGEQGPGAMPLVIMRHRRAAPFLQGQPGLGTIQALDLALLVGAEHQGFVRRMEVEPHHIRQLFDEPGIATDLAGPSSMRLEPVGLPDPMDGFGAHAHHGGQGASRPVCGRWRWGRRGEGHDPLHGGGPDARRAAGARGVLLDAGQPSLGEPATPASDASPSVCRVSAMSLFMKPSAARSTIWRAIPGGLASGALEPSVPRPSVHLASV